MGLLRRHLVLGQSCLPPSSRLGKCGSYVVHDEPKLGLNVCPNSPSTALPAVAIKVASSQSCSITWNGVRWQRWTFASWLARHHLRGLYRLPDTPESLARLR